MNKKAFTLAEVLIILMILGVIAAITIPSLIQNHQKKTTAVGAKKMYSTLSQALQRSIVDNGTPEGWSATSGSNLFQKYLKPYLNIKNENTFTQIYPNGWLQINGQKETALAIINQGTVYTLINGNTIITGGGNLSNIRRSYAFFDINGKNTPNQIGKDIFEVEFGYIGNGQIICPYGAYNLDDGPFGEMTRDNIKNGGGNNYKCSKSGRGMFCLALIIVDGWEIADDYPW